MDAQARSITIALLGRTTWAKSGSRSARPAALPYNAPPMCGARAPFRKNPPRDPALLSLVRRDSLGEAHQRDADAAVGDLGKRARQPHGLAARQERERIVVRPRSALHRLDSLQQRRHRHVERHGDLGEAPGADPIAAVLVFLDLLER